MIEIKLNDEPMQRALAQIQAHVQNRRQAMRDIAISMESAVVDNFESSGKRLRPSWPGRPTKYPRLSDAAKLLIRTGKLMGSITRRSSNDVAAVGTNLPYARFMQEGTRAHNIVAKNAGGLAFGPALTTMTGKSGRKLKNLRTLKTSQGATMRQFVHQKVHHPGTPPRPFLALNEVDKSDILDIIGQHILKKL